MDNEPDNEYDMDTELTRDFQDEDPAIYDDNRYHEEFSDFVGEDGQLHARAL